MWWDEVGVGGVLALLNASGFLIGGGAALDTHKGLILQVWTYTHVSLEKHMVSVITYIFFKQEKEKKTPWALKMCCWQILALSFSASISSCVCLVQEVLSKKQKARRGNVIWGCFSSQSVPPLPHPHPPPPGPCPLPLGCLAPCGTQVPASSQSPVPLWTPAVNLQDIPRAQIIYFVRRGFN